MTKLDQYKLSNGLTILAEPMHEVESVAFDFLIPAGAALMPAGFCGAANVISDWIFRGAGNKNNRQLGDALDSLGLHRDTSVSSSHIAIGAALESDNLLPTLLLYSDIILHPALSQDQFVPARQLALDEVLALKDDPRQEVMLKLREQFYPPPFNRSTIGTTEDLNALDAATAAALVQKYFDVSKTILAVAGKYNFHALCSHIEKLFSSAVPKPAAPVSIGTKGAGYTHTNTDSAQVHIGLCTQTVPPSDKDYYNARVAVSVLSGGMSARLFTEVREKRGLCYAIGAKYHCHKQNAGIMCYAGTTPDKGQETLDVIINEFNRLSADISDEEIQRAQAGLKSALILQSESSSSRATGIGSDYYMLGRVRSLDEIKAAIEATSAKSVLDFLRNNPFKDFTIVTIGPKQLNIK